MNFRLKQRFKESGLNITCTKCDKKYFFCVCEDKVGRVWDSIPEDEDDELSIIIVELNKLIL